MFQLMNEIPVTWQAPATNATATARTYPWFITPRACTLIAAYAAVNTGITTANTTSFFSLSLIAGGTVGTSTLTIATFGSAATPYAWTNNQGYQATIDTTTNKDLAATTWVHLREEGTSTSLVGLIAVTAHIRLGTGRVA